MYDYFVSSLLLQPRTGTTLLHRLLSLDRSSRAPLTWELFDPTRRVVDDPVQDCKKRITFCQKNINFLISLAPHIDQIHPMAADFPEECLMALVRIIIFLASNTVSYCSLLMKLKAKIILAPLTFLFHYFLLGTRCTVTF